MKRGVTPLVATILLILFSIALGAVVMNWGKSYIEERSEFITGDSREFISVNVCDQVQTNLIYFGDNPQLCVEDSLFFISLQNGVRIPIEDFHVRLLDSSGNIFQERSILSKPLSLAEARKVGINFSSLNNIAQVFLIPIVDESGTPKYCEKKAIKYEGLVGDC